MGLIHLCSRPGELCGWWREPVAVNQEVCPFFSEISCMSMGRFALCFSFLVFQRIIVWLKRGRKGFETNDMLLVI